MPFRPGVIGAVLAVSLAVPAGASAADQNVSALANDTFSPDDVTVNAGESVTWRNMGGGNHNVVLDQGNTALNSPSTSNWTLAHTFNDVGVFQYYCQIHGDPGGMGMSGVVRVVAAPPPPPGGGPPTPTPPGGSPPGGNPPSGPGAPGGDRKALSVSLKFSDATPLAGKRVRVFGVVKPARDGRKVQIQKRLRSGKFKAIATARLKAAPGDKSVYALRLRLSADTVLRARVAGDDEVATGLSKGRKLDVHRPA
jgi:plastocyanin